MGEDWKPVPEWEDRYEVSSMGRIRSAVTGKVLKPGPHPRGYKCARLYRNGKRTATSLHAVIARTFHGPCPKGMEVRHKDGSKTNNKPENLAYATHQDNMADMLAHGTIRRGEEVNFAVLSAQEVLAIRSDYRTQKEIAFSYGVTHSNISAIKLRKSWRHV